MASTGPTLWQGDPSLARRLAAEVHLLHTRLLDFSCALRPPARPWSGDLFTAPELGFGWHRLDAGIGYALHLSVKAVPVQDQENVLWTCDATQEIVYTVDNPGRFSDDELGAFAVTSAALTVYPFLRELVHSASLRSGLPLLLDVLRTQ